MPTIFDLIPILCKAEKKIVESYTVKITGEVAKIQIFQNLYQIDMKLHRIRYEKELTADKRR
jgi:hypothetical protein